MSTAKIALFVFFALHISSLCMEKESNSLIVETVEPDVFSLPVEIRFLIFGYFSEQDFPSIKQTCRAWNDEFWQFYFVRRFGSRSIPERMSWRRFFIKTLSLQNADHLTQMPSTPGPKKPLFWINAYFDRTTSMNMNLKNSHIHGAVFHDWKHNKLDFTGAKATRLLVVGGQLEEANFSNALLSGSFFDGTFLKEAVFRDAICERTKFLHVDLVSADLHQGNFTGSDFSRSTFSKTRLSRGLFREACFHEARFLHQVQDQAISEACFSKADFHKADFENVEINRSSFDETNFNRAKITGCNAMFLDFRRANLHAAGFDSCHLIKANFQETNWKNAAIARTTIVFGDFSHATLTEIRLDQVIFASCQWSGARMNANIDLSKATFLDENGDPISDGFHYLKTKGVIFEEAF